MRGIRKAKTYLDYIPSREDIKCLLNSVGLKLKVAVSLMAFSGLRLVDVCNLRYSNIQRSFEAGEEVLTIVLRQRKTGEWYFTFLGPQGTGYIRQLLERRKRKGEQIKPETFIVSDNGEKTEPKALKRALKLAIKRSVGRHPTGEPFRVFRPYGLRKYFRRQIRGLGSDVAEFLMGHASGTRALSAVYSGLADLDQKVIDDLKRQYISVLPDLETELSQTTVANEISELKARLTRMEDFMRQWLNLNPEDLAYLMRVMRRLRLKRAAQIDREVKAMEDHELIFSV